MFVQHHTRCDRGFTLLETLVALALLLIFMAGVGELSATAMRSARRAREQTVAVVLAAQKLEALRGAAAAGLAPTWSSPEALERDEPCCSDRLDESGNVLSVAADRRLARYVRRWLVQPLPGGSPEACLLRVLVVPAVAVAGGQTPPRNQTAVVLTSAYQG